MIFVAFLQHLQSAKNDEVRAGFRSQGTLPYRFLHVLISAKNPVKSFHVGHINPVILQEISDGVRRWGTSRTLLLRKSQEVSSIFCMKLWNFNFFIESSISEYFRFFKVKYAGVRAGTRLKDLKVVSQGQNNIELYRG